jgi:prophage regulatory protein
MTADNDNQPVLISPKEAARETSLSRQLLMLMARAGEFPAPVRLGERRTAYVRAEVVDWVNSRIAARSARAA